MCYHIIYFYLKIFNQFIFSLYSVYLCIFTTNLLFFQTPVLSKIQHSTRQISHRHTNVCHTTRGMTGTNVELTGRIQFLLTRPRGA